MAFLKIWYSIKPFPARSGRAHHRRGNGRQGADPLQDADAEIAKAGADKNLGQYFAALTNMRSAAAWEMKKPMATPSPSAAVLTSDFMTAESAQIPWEYLAKVSGRIVNEVKASEPRV